MSDNLKALRKIAEQATPGPWEMYDANEDSDHAPLWCVANDEFHNPSGDEDAEWIAVEVHTGDKPDAEFIATFDPPTVLALIEEIDRLQSENVTLAGLAKARREWNKKKHAELTARLEQAENGREQAVIDYEAAELKLLRIRDLSKYLKKLAPGDKHYAELIDRALDGELNE